MVQGRGFYSGKAGEMVLCAIRKNEFYQIRRIVRECDAGAFVIVLDVTQVFGLGFETPGGDLPAAKEKGIGGSRKIIAKKVYKAIEMCYNISIFH